MLALKGKVALVTGGNSGIGRATALAMANEGASVVIGARRVPEGNDTVAMITHGGGEAFFVQTDVSNEADVEALVAATIEQYGRLDCAFNTAGIMGVEALIADTNKRDWDAVITTNLTGIWLCIKHEVMAMLKQGGGSIVNDSSSAGLVGDLSASAAYTASKHGVVGLTKAAALEYANQKIRVNAVCPGWIDTPMVEGTPDIETVVQEVHPLGRIGRPEEIAAAVVWLLSDAASFVTGHALPVDGGLVAQ